MALERLDEGAMLELVREVEPALVTRVGEEVDHDLVHAAELGVHHVLELGVGESGKDSLGPGREGDLHLQRGFVAGEAIGVAEAAEGLVEGVPRRPLAVQVEGGGADLAPGEFAKGPPSSGESAEVAVPVGVLHLLELGDQIVGAVLESLVTGRGPHQAHRRQVVASDVAREVAAIPVPAAVPLCPRRETGPVAVVREHPVGLQLEQVAGVQVLRVLERSAGEADGAQRDRPCLDDIVEGGCDGSRSVLPGCER